MGSIAAAGKRSSSGRGRRSKAGAGRWVEGLETRTLFAAAIARGSLLDETWINISGTAMTALTSNANYPNHPSGRVLNADFQTLSPNWATNYGERVRGYVLPETSGTYTFTLTGNNTSELYLSTDDTSANEKLIAWTPSAAGHSSPQPTSAPVTLAAGTAYFVELRHKAGTGADTWSVTWTPPGSASAAAIPTSNLAPFGVNTPLPTQASILSTLASGHPRILTSSEQFQWVRQQIATNSQFATWYQNELKKADSILTQPVAQYVLSTDGNILATSRTVLDRVQTLAFVYQIGGDSKYAERAWTELDNAAKFPDWHPSHFLDTAEMTHAFSIGYDWLYSYWTAARKSELSTSIINLGLKPGLSAYQSKQWFFQSTANNWNLVCNGGMTLGALAVANDNATLASQILEYAIPSVLPVMAHFTNGNGGWYEGPGYWGFATEYNVRMMAAMQTALGSAFGLDSVAGVNKTGYYAIYDTGAAGQSFNYADAGSGAIAGPQMFWYGLRYNDPNFDYWERSHMGSTPNTLDLLWYNPAGSDPVTAKLPLDHYFAGESETVDMRSAWNDPNATFVGFKAGQNAQSHGDLDIGDFVLDALGKRWAMDLGSDNYALPGYFDNSKQRWTYYRKRAEGQNTLVINPGSGPDQNLSAKTKMIRTGFGANSSFSIADMTAAYNNVTSVQRGIQLLNGNKDVIVQDEIKAVTGKTLDTWWFMHTQASNITVAADGKSAILTQGTARLWVKILSGPGTAKIAVMPATPLPTSPNPSGQNPNTGIQKLAIHMTGVTSTTLSVMMVPLNPTDTPPTTVPPVTALSTWKAS